MTILFGAPVFMPGDRVAAAAEPHGSQSNDYEALASKHVASGYAAAYAPKLASNDHAAIALARDSFERAGVTIAEVGCWTNLLADDVALRSSNFTRMAEALALADELGAVCALVTVGSVRSEGVEYHDPRNYSDEAFDKTVATARRLLDAVKPTRAKLAFEALPFDFTDTPEGMRRLLEAIDRPEVAAHVDLVNWLLVSPRRYWDQLAVIDEMIECLGSWTVAAHCKDLQLQTGYDQLIVEVPLGHGHLDLRAYLKALDSLDGDVTLLLEHQRDAAAYEAAVAHVRAEAEAVGVKLRPPEPAA